MRRTPGTWRVEQPAHQQSKRVVGPAGQTVAGIVSNEADATLVSAAPELYEALKELLAESLDWQEALGKGDRPSLDDAILAAQSALRKAMGKS